MPSSDALLLGEEFLSEHYFTTDATSQSFQAKVLERRKQWDTAHEEGHPTARSRYTAQRRELTGAFLSLAENADEDTLDHLYARLREILGFDNPIGLTVERVGGVDQAPGPALTASATGLSGPAPLVIVEARGGLALEDLLAKDEKSLLRAYLTDEVPDGRPITSVARLLSHLFVTADGPQFALVLAGGLALVTERERWPEGRYLAVDLQLVGERADAKRGGEIDRALTCLAAESLAPDAEGALWWSRVIEESVKHTVGVSEDLREGVRLSIEIIANDVVTRRKDQGLEPLPPEQAQPLARDALRFLYRILFLLYAEASPELAVLPVGEPAYERGYSIDRLRELTLTELVSPRARAGTHLYESLAVLFDLVDRGHDGTTAPADGADGATVEGLVFQPLRADLFKPEAIALIDEVKLGNAALQQVLRHLLLSKQVKGRDRGFISYAQLGINQLGAVYEGLMSYTGSFATEDLYEVAKNGDSSKGSWVVPATRIDGISENDFVKTEDPDTGERKPVLHRRGTFVYRLSGRERQQSASYYSPEVLTRFVVGQAVEELLDQNGQTTPARDILELTICEPALGSGAFAIEAVQQLAEQYLCRRQDELDQHIDPDRYAAELQKVKAYLALHQTYGVDLNATAVEFAEISLWLATMGEGLAAPWFGLHLRRGNSLVGARHALIPAAALREKGWLTAMPVDRPLSTLGDDLAGAAHHFLLPVDGWGASVDAKEAKELAPEALERLKGWRKSLRPKPTTTQIASLAALARRTERLWSLALRRLQIAESEIRRAIDVWGVDDLPDPGGAVSREAIEASLADPNGAYQRLRRVMDAWCALWFWPLTAELTTVDGELVSPPSLAQWIDALQQLLGLEAKVSRRDEQQLSFADIDDWDDLGVAEDNDLAFAQAKNVDVVLATHPWLVVCERLAGRHGFFHWELDFAPAFARGGFDLQVGNPPWVRPRSDVDALLAEGDPWFQLAVKPTQAAVRAKRDATLALPRIRDLLIDGTTEIVALAAFVGDARQYRFLKGLQPDLYRCFMEQTWRSMSPTGVVSLITPESHFTDEKAGLLRKESYLRLKRHWQFGNNLKWFQDAGNVMDFGIHVYGPPRSVWFQNGSHFNHPATVTGSLRHNGDGPEPGIKDLDGHWDLRPHAGRIITVTNDVLAAWRDILENPDTPVPYTRMVYSVNRSAESVLRKLSDTPRIDKVGLQFSRGWDESIDRTKGYFEIQWGAPNSWYDVILQGPHLQVSTPMYKWPNPTMASHRDWSATDFEALATNAIPATSYKPKGERSQYDTRYTSWKINSPDSETGAVPARDYYRIAWRRRTGSSEGRTLLPALIPPGAAHIHQVYAAGLPQQDPSTLVITCACLSALLSDFSLQIAQKAEIPLGTLNRLPIIDLDDKALLQTLILRTLRLNCVTDAYTDLWRKCFDPTMQSDSWAGGFDHARRQPLGAVEPEWSHDTPLRIAADRRQALVEIDALVAVGLGLTADELCTVYRTQFPVLYGYDRNTYLYDTNGRLVPQEVLSVWRKKSDDLTIEERTATNQAGNTYTYETPFRFLDREADMRAAYAEFAGRLAIWTR